MKTRFMKFARKMRRSYGKYEIRRNGVWFVDIPRTSSTSIKVELSRRFGAAYGKQDFLEDGFVPHSVFNAHIPAAKMKRRLGAEVWERLYTFSVVRNPWDRMLSLFNYRQKIGDIPENMTYAEYLRELAKLEWGKPGRLFHFHGYYMGSADYVSDSDGQILVSKICRLENRTEDLDEVATKICLPELGRLRTQQLKPGRQHYSTFYDSESRKIIGKLYAKDIELFGYDFETG